MYTLALKVGERVRDIPLLCVVPSCIVQNVSVHLQAIHKTKHTLLHTPNALCSSHILAVLAYERSPLQYLTKVFTEMVRDDVPTG